MVIYVNPCGSGENWYFGLVFLNVVLFVAMEKMKRQLVLNKGSQKFIFRYDSGCEDELLEVLIEQARDERTDFDWFDAAVLSFRLTQTLIGQADELIHQNGNPQP